MIPVKTFKDSVLNLIEKNNTTTSSYDISSGLSTRVQRITGSNSKKQPVYSFQYPCVFVEVKNDTESILTLGNLARRGIEVNMDVVAVIDYGIGLDEAREESDDEMLLLCDNLKNLFRNFITLSGTVDSLECPGSTYDADYAENTYNANGRISILIKKRG